MNKERHDAMLMEILQEQRTVLGFLQSVFGFLSRCTDFYHVMKTEEDTIGFLPGFKEQLVLQVMKQFEIKEKNFVESVPAATNEIEIVSEEIIDNEENLEKENDICENKEKEFYNNDKLFQSDSLCNRTNMKFQPNEFYNGAKFDIYCWSQTINDIEIHIALPDDILSSKDLKVAVESDYLSIFNKKSNRVILEGKIYSKCKSNETVWSISEKKLQINFDKIKSNWWHKLFLNEKLIDLKNMDCTRSLHDLSQEDQTVIEKLQWDHQQKMLGLPTSEDIKNREILRQAWNAEGSPFKGQPFDSSIVKFD